jgi:hypothetical protein
LQFGSANGCFRHLKCGSKHISPTSYLPLSSGAAKVGFFIRFFLLFPIFFYFKTPNLLIINEKTVHFFLSAAGFYFIKTKKNLPFWGKVDFFWGNDLCDCKS